MRTIKVESSLKRLREVYVIASFLKETEHLVELASANDDDWGPVFQERLSAVIMVATCDEKAVLLKMASPIFSRPRLSRIRDAQCLIWKEFLQISLSSAYDPNNLFWIEVLKAAYPSLPAQEEVCQLSELIEKRIHNLSILLRIEPLCTLYPAAEVIARKRKNAASLRP